MFDEYIVVQAGLTHTACSYMVCQITNQTILRIHNITHPSNFLAEFQNLT